MRHEQAHRYGRAGCSELILSIPLFNSVQIQPANVRTRKGYAKKGSGEAVGRTCSPQKILAAVIAKRIAPTVPARRIQLANSLGTLVSRSAADHKAVPAAND